MAEVILEKVTKSYGLKQVIKELDLVVNDCEFMVLVGPSGCGKSTILRMIAGLETITSGKVLIGNQMVNNTPPKDRDIAMVFQNYALYPHMTVYENMAFGLRFRKTEEKEINKRVNDAAQILEIDELLMRKPRELSGGQRQRVALGRAIVRKPQVFLFDEPLSNLDAKLRVQMRTEISRLHEKLKTTVIYVTHDQTEAMTMGNRITLLTDGLIQQIGTPLELYKKPANLFVAGFIGSPPMNFFPVSINVSDGTTNISGEHFHFSLPEQELECKIPDNQDTQFMLGIRPEGFKILEAGQKPPSFLKSTWTAYVDVSENMGSEQLIYGKVEGSDQTCVVRLAPEYSFPNGTKISLFPDITHLHFFTNKNT